MKHPNDTKRKNSNSGSLGQFLRSRGCPISIYLLNRGRNSAKRVHRASKTSRKHWRKVA